MSNEKEKKIFSNNLNYYLSINGKTQSNLINDLGINKSTVSTWCNGTKMPRMGSIQTLADYFHIRKSDLIEEKKKVQNLDSVSLTLSSHEIKVIMAYHHQPDMQAAVDKLLGITPQREEHFVPVVCYLREKYDEEV